MAKSVGVGKRHIVVSAVGPDRPGLVSEISAVIHREKGNIEDSRMAILGGEFALILLVSGADAALVGVEKAIPALEKRMDLRFTLKATAPAPVRAHLPYRMKVTGLDHPGIVHGVTSLLAAHGVNVAALETKLAHAPLSGTPLFVLQADLMVPTEVAVSRLRRELEEVCEKENLDFSLEGTGGAAAAV